jgi:glutamate dehydrogenase (NADP+)
LTERHDELDDIDAFMEWVAERHPGEEEYHQAVRGVAVNVLDMARDNRSWREQRVLQRMTEPDRMLSFRVAWEDDEGQVQINRGYRVQLSNAIGPYKGGLRFDPTVNPSVLKFLAFEQLFKNSLTGLNLGAGKGGADFDPRGRSDREVMRFCHAFMTELHRHIGQLTDVPAGDIGVGSREIGYLFGQYRRLENRFAGALTGKAVGVGGSELRQEATGFGAVFFLRAMLEDADRELRDLRVAISGAGNVAVHAGLKAAQLGARVLTLSNRAGTLRKPDGLSVGDIEQLRDRYPETRDLADLAEAVDAEWLEGEKPWATECDVAIPSATQNELELDDARNLADAGCRIVVEGANMPLTDDAERHLAEAGVQIAPGKAANAGGVAVSGLEMSQNQIGQTWPREQLEQQLNEIMCRIYRRCREAGHTQDGVNFRRGADRAGFHRVARAVAVSGIM